MKGLQKLLEIERKDYNAECVERYRSMEWCKELKKKVRKAGKDAGFNLAEFHNGYCEASGFIEKEGKVIYFSFGDYRFDICGRKWYNDVLIRTAKDTKDFTGGTNRYTTFADFETDVLKLFTARN